MKLKPYPKYVDSGVEWLGEIPEGWKLNPLFTVLLNHYEQNTGMLCFDVLSLSYGELILKDVSDNYGLLPESFETYQLVEPNDIILRLTDLQNDQRSLRTAISRYRGIITSAYLKLRCIQNSSYFHWQLFSIDTQKVFYGQGGGVRQSMKYADLKRLPVVIPPLLTQQTIASFLDSSTARIDSLVHDYEELIALLQEKRQALISHAVTRGLSELVRPDDPDFGEWAKPVKFVYSGVEWLGEIPANWELGPLKRFFQVIDCKHLTAPFVDEGFPLASITEVQGDIVDLTNAAKTTEEYYDQLIEGGRKPEAGDLIFCRNVAVGEVALVPPDLPDFSMGQEVCLLKRKVQNYAGAFLIRLLRSLPAAYQINGFMIGATFKRINVEQIRDLLIVMPDDASQSAISSFLSRETAKIDALVKETQDAIGLLKEHRAALITNAVTGKIDVEEWTEA